jgi:hypothetical protein
MRSETEREMRRRKKKKKWPARRRRRESAERENYLCWTCWCVCLSAKEKIVGSRGVKEGCLNELGENGLRK